MRDTEKRDNKFSFKTRGGKRGGKTREASRYTGVQRKVKVWSCLLMGDN